MSQVFNPYREWLGVLSTNPSPSYYELLGLPPLEADLGKINAAYQRQSSRLATQLSGNQDDVAQRLLGELAEARMTLLTPTAKRAYDQALAARGPVPTASTGAAAERSTASDVAQMLPPAATPQPVSPTSMAAAPYAGGPAFPLATPQPNPIQGYVPVGYPAPQVYPAPQAYAPAQGYAGWQPQPASQMAPYPAAGYYAAPQSAATVEMAPAPAQLEPAEMTPTIRRRPARRRSSSAPALIGVAIVVAGGLAGTWYYFQGNQTVAVIKPTDDQTRSAGTSDTTTETEAERSDELKNGRMTNDVRPPIKVQSPADAGREPVRPKQEDTQSPDADSMKPKPASDGVIPRPQSEKPDADTTKPEPDKPQPDKPKHEPKSSETKAGPEEAAAVSKALKAVRAALASRDLSKAKDLLDEATIEASASDSLVAVKRVELLTSYVDMFWDAARKTLPKLQAAETIEIDGTMMAVVEADEEHLIVRIEGRNRDYPWKKIPTKIAYYLADRWLAKNDAIRNLVLAAFQIVEPKGDLIRAQSLLDAAAAAGLDARPLIDELKVARGVNPQ